MQQVGGDAKGTGSAKDLSTQVNYLNDLLDKGAINEEEYDRRAQRLHRIGDVIACVIFPFFCINLSLRRSRGLAG